MRLRPGANEIRELVAKLGSRSPARSNEARSRLCALGARAVDALVEALDGDSVRVRFEAIALLTLLQHPRGRDALIGLLMDRDARTREAAARALSRFSSPRAVSALESVLARDPLVDVRLAAVSGLVGLYRAGQEQAVRRVLELLMDTRQDARLRSAAAALVAFLGPSQRRGILNRMRRDPDPAIVRRATEIEDAVTLDAGAPGLALAPLVERLASPDHDVWQDAVRALASTGPAAVVPLVHAMQRRAHDAEFGARAGMALKAIGPRGGRALAAALDHVDEPIPLQTLVEVIGSVGDKALVYKLRDLLDRLGRIGAARHVNGFDPVQRVRAKAHLELARVGSRVAVADLVALVRCDDRPTDFEALDALELVGTHEEITVLLGAWRREDRAARQRIGEVVRAIMRRERIRKNSKTFACLDAGHRRVLDAIVRPVAPRSAASGTQRRALV